MADNIFRSLRGRDTVAREDVDPDGREGAGDPLAELARLIGQSDPHGEAARHERYSQHSGDDQAAPGLDWASDDGYAPEPRADDRYAPPLADSYSSDPPQSYPPQSRGHADESVPGGRFFSGAAAKFSGFHGESGDDPAADDADYQDDQQPASAGQRSASRASGDHYEDDEQYDDSQPYAPADDYQDAPSPRRRGGLVVVMAVLGLAVLGTAGAFGYRAMFGGSVLPGLPPIIKPANGPNKIMPSYGDAQASNASQAGAGGTSSAEKLVSNEEQPVEIHERLRSAPRVVATIPIAPQGQGLGLPGPAVPTAPFNAAPVTPTPVGAPPAFGSQGQMAAPVPPANAAATPASSGPKKVHTVTIRSDQPAGADTAAAPPASRAAAPAPRPTKTAAGQNGPLSLVPSGQGDVPPPAPARTHTAAAPASVASATPVALTAAVPSSGGGYAVQVTSQRSEADAQAAFQALRAKFPTQLGGREPIIRRADLGAKGTYYRALVGPFASAEEAAGICSSLKTAGGSCLVQRN